jgi:hypothetical protein
MAVHMPPDLNKRDFNKKAPPKRGSKVAEFVDYAAEKLGFRIRNSGFVSGHRFSDAVSLSQSPAPLGALQRESTVSAAL